MIALVNPRSSPSPRPSLPMSLLALGAVLEGEADYVIIDGNVVPDAAAVVMALARRTPLTAIGVTVMPGPQLAEAVPLSRALKRALPDVPIVWGGYFPSQHADVCLRDPAVDVCVHGQGEQTFLEVVRALAAGGDLEAIPGISVRRDGGVHRTASRPLVPLDTLPDWPHHRVEMSAYIHAHYLGRRVVAHHSSFGCPFACSFCAVVGIANRRWVAQSPGRVVATLARLQREHGVDAVQFHDMDFFISEPRTAAIADGLAPLGLSWWALGRVDELMRYRDDTWTRLRRSGLRMVFCGAESGSSETLARMNKGGTATAEQTLALAARARAFDVVPEFSFVVGNPPDPEGDFRLTLEFIRRVKAVNDRAEIIIYVYAPVPGEGAAAADVEARGFRFPETLDDWISGPWQRFATRREARTPWVNGSIRRKVHEFEAVLNAYYPTVTDLRLTPARRSLLRGASAWRYRARVYGHPVELQLLQRVFHYRRPETMGF